jgi:hypothetical protein
MRDFNSDGIFWLPDNPTERVPGRLTFDQVKGGSLKLLGAFGDLTALTDEAVEHPRILGIAGKRLLTLERNLETGNQIEVPGGMTQTFRVGLVLAGVHFNAGESLNFSSISASLDNLEEWVGQSGVTIQLEEQSGSPGFSRIGIEYRPPARDTAPFDRGNIELGFTYGLGGDHRTETRLTQGCYLRVRPNTSADLATVLLPYAQSLQDLLTLAVGEAQLLDETSLTHVDLFREVDGRRYDESVYLLLQNRETAHENVRRRLPNEMVFTLEDIGGVEGVARWVELAERNRPILGLLLSPRYMSRMYVENRFLNYVFAAETYHRAHFNNEVLPRDAFRTKKRRILRRVPWDQRRWLTEQLANSNEPRLRARLAEMVEHVGPPFEVMVPNATAWARTVANLRNDLAHGRAGNSLGEDYGRVIHSIGESVSYLVVACLLKELDSSAMVVAKLSNHRNFQFVAEQLQQVLN